MVNFGAPSMSPPQGCSMWGVIPHCLLDIWNAQSWLVMYRVGWSCTELVGTNGTMHVRVIQFPTVI